MTAEAATPRRRAGDRAVAALPGGGDRGWSLLRRIAWIATAAALAAMVFGSLAMYSAASIQNEQMLDSRLEQFGATIQSIVDERLTDFRQGGPTMIPHAQTRPTAALLYHYQVWSRHGSLVMRSHEAPATRPMVALARLGYSSIRIDGDEHRVFALPSRDGEFVIQVAEDLGQAWNQVETVTAYYAAFLLIPFGLLLGATWWLLHRALRSINTLADNLKSRNPMDVTTIVVADPPREVVPIVAAMDMLFGRMQRALSIERSFTSMAAHEMRTPLAGLRAEAQFLSRAGLPDGAASEAVTSLIRGVDRASYMLDQLLDLARVENLALAGRLHLLRVPVADLHDEVIADLAPRIQKKGTRLSVRIEVGPVRCHAFALSLLLRNLLANAVVYSPVGGRVEVQYLQRDGEFVLAIDDSGEGIAARDRERAFERFNRLGRTGSDGVGLGLSIVLSVVAMHDARIELMDSPLGGLRVQVSFPQPPDAPVPASAPD